MKHYWINVDESVYRYAFMKSQLERLGIENVRISAVTPEKMKGLKILRLPESQEIDLEISAVLSHIKAIKQGYDDGDEHFCILEDDMYLPKLDFNKINKYAKETGDNDIETIQFFTSSNVLIIDLLNKYIRKENPQFIVKRDTDYPSAGYYMISRSGAKKLLDLFMTGDNTYDLTSTGWAVADNIIYKPINSYILTYPIAITNINCGSLIHSDHLANHNNANNVVLMIHNKFNILHYFISP
jgi:GR25 family glycosyltransferase involved in LPS biosynthesis